ncbi:sigma-70 family RNA polymerase sigma factor [Calycomorphotria hydatis]|uniref:RNA polymerase sigma factor n=1 Tax=Calycomorphotria hydatis TaxID=2528027 RepID=A0A517TBJ6_9PLAN|nr:sigma-70 family RNA polymerase sigma factor [Calycomorphotria hydatis]QDT65748.1 RNA polymerase sigma factor [Calycomorphotria hydatis]
MVHRFAQSELDEDFPVTEGDSEKHLLFTSEFASSYWKIYARVLVFVPDRHDADDVMQEISLVLWRKFEDFSPGTSFSKWAGAVALNVARTFVRGKRRSRRVTLDEDVLQGLAQVQSGAQELLELRRLHLESCLDSMSERDRDFLMTCESRHGAVSKLSRELNQPAHRLYERLNRLRRKLTNCIQRSLGAGEAE